MKKPEKPTPPSLDPDLDLDQADAIPELAISTPDQPRLAGDDGAPFNPVRFIESQLRAVPEQLQGIRGFLFLQARCLKELGPRYHAEDDSPLDREAQLIGRIEIAGDLLDDAARILRGYRPSTLPKRSPDLR